MNDVKKILLDAYRDGWVPVNGGKHIKLIHPTGARVIVARSASDRRAAMNIRADLRRALRRRTDES